MKIIMKTIGIPLLLLLGMGRASYGLTPQQLQQMLQKGDKLTLIDIRSGTQYTQGHIQGAINMPGEVLEKKPLPPLGKVIVYGDGINKELSTQALKALNAKPGIQAELLEGGMMAWEGLNQLNTSELGVTGESFHQVSYAELEKLAATAEAILVDLRNVSKTRTNLTQRFPQAVKIDLALSGKMDAQQESRIVAGVLQGKAPNPAKLYVLIDEGDGRSEQAARPLWAAGLKRLAILTGGEFTLQQRGLTGQQTVGGE